MIARLLLAPLLALAACAPQPLLSDVHAPVGAPPPAPAITGEVLLAAGTPALQGTLVVGWLTPAEAADRAAGHQDIAAFRRLIERFQVIGPVDLARTPRAPFRIEAPPDAVPLAVLDLDHSFWATMFGHGASLLGVGKTGGGEVVLTPHPAEPPAAEPCHGDRYQLIVVPAPEVEGAVKNPTARRFCAYLPPSYGTATTKRYPIVLMLPGLLSGEMTRLRGKHSAAESADTIARETGREAILVGVDTSTRTGSTYLTDSPVTGAFDTFLAGRGLDALDAALRTIRDRGARGLVGNSTGGYNALSFGLRHPERFSAIGASSPDAPDMRAWLLGPEADRAKPWITAWTRLEDAVGGPGQMTSYASDWSPDPTRPHGFAWPIDLDTGRVYPAILAGWVAHTPTGLLGDALTRARTRYGFGGRIFITVGRGDEFDLFEPARRFSETLTASGVEHTFVPTDGGHGAGAPERIEAALRFVITRLAAAR